MNEIDYSVLAIDAYLRPGTPAEGEGSLSYPDGAEIFATSGPLADGFSAVAYLIGSQVISYRGTDDVVQDANNGWGGLR